MPHAVVAQMPPVDPDAKLERLETDSLSRVRARPTVGGVTDSSRVKLSSDNGYTYVRGRVRSSVSYGSRSFSPSRFLCGGGTAADLRCDAGS